MDRGAWQAAVHGVAKSRTRLSNFTSLHFLTTEPLKKPLLLINLLLITTQSAPKSPPTLPKTLLSKYPSIMGISQVY